jgi:hypothetical protein
VELLRVARGGPGGQIVPGQRVQMTVIWRIWGIPPTTDDYSFTVQLFSEDWLRWLDLNDHFLRTRYWHVGDQVGTTVRGRVPADAPPGGHYHLVVALYTYREGGVLESVDVLDEAFNPAGTYAVVPLD